MTSLIILGSYAEACDRRSGASAERRLSLLELEIRRSAETPLRTKHALWQKEKEPANG